MVKKKEELFLNIKILLSQFNNIDMKLKKNSKKDRLVQSNVIYKRYLHILG